MYTGAIAEEARPGGSLSASALRRVTWGLAWPVIFSFSIESLVGLCDTLMVGRLGATAVAGVGSSRVDLQACKLEYSIVSPK